MTEKKRSSGRFWVPNWVADGMLTKLKGGELKTLIALTRFAGKEGLAWPSVSTLSDMTGQDARTVRRHLRRLENPLGLISRVSVGRGGRGLTTKYKLMAESWKNLSAASTSEDSSAIVRGTSVTGLQEEPPEETRTPVTGLQDENADTGVHKGGHEASERGTPVSAEGSEKEVFKVCGVGKIGNDKNGALRRPLSAADMEQRRQKMVQDLEVYQNSEPAMVAG